jgi:transposase
VRVSTAFNRLLPIPGAWVTDVVIGERDVEVTLRPKAHRLQCPCGILSSAVYDRRRRRWRHLDLGIHRLWLAYEIRRLDCPDCGVRTEELPWARPGARHTRDFEDTVLWLAQRTDRTSVATLMRCGGETVTAIINRGVAELLDARRLETLYRIGVDEICYRHPHHYLTIVGDHDTGTVIDIQPGRSEQSLANFYESQPDSMVSGSRWSAWTSPRPTAAPPAPMPPRPPSVMTRSTSCNGSTGPWTASTPKPPPDPDAPR